ncbi:GNAT family N-acetyltransferase [Commensalibacter papalotli (ex Botero et al. 2024)]|uniref:RimJ/RimL family (RimL) (PDB:1S7F) n=1 Tax=Commensalibacter papalotli (ex Botero et al. 2024) TaxID=2972766 RepID=A0ABM9HM14_9PROT|nr:GNAT family protein [Commensalibacter papalotli (ex Botero et al. 2024)]CAI3935772.1 Protein N-acetyltransferase [Commensalibacter papalotli (ex Botero et al. 2024)]CAI3951931.1 Protein N-acetyltransferase [Commensalibacter papalotli (ex Botero et al. 2024)]
MTQHSFFPKQDLILTKNNVRLEPLTLQHISGLQKITDEEDLWKLRVTVIPHPSKVKDYITEALEAKSRKERYPFAVIEDTTGKIIGTTSFFEITPDVRRLEIGYTWYAKNMQRTHVNTNCKSLLLEYAFEQLRTNIVVLRTDIFNFKSQKAIERLGAKKDGILRGHILRQDGTIRDTIVYTIAASEWPNIKIHLSALLNGLY